jgi:AcrR family transcriptional regulator
VADAAGVSPNLITRYFGGKDGLFLAATQVEIPVAISIEGDRSSLGARLAESIVARWFDLAGVLTRRRLLRSDLGDRAELEQWLGATIQRLADD